MAQVLIVEDDKLLNQAYQLILEKEGHDVDVAENGREALDLVAGGDPDVILLDLQMPEMTGLEFLQKYDLTKHEDTTVVILSNVGDEKEIQKAVELGAYKYIVKAQATPIQLSVLVNNLIQKNIDHKHPTP